MGKRSVRDGSHLFMRPRETRRVSKGMGDDEELDNLCLKDGSWQSLNIWI